MPSDADRVAQVFIWKEGTPPDFDYARHVLTFVNPDTARLLQGHNPPPLLSLYTVRGAWPDEPWELAIADMRSVPTPDGTPWTDTSRYDLAGWQGTDSNTGERLFTVTAYRRAAPPSPFTGSSVSAPPPPPLAVSQVPYYPQFPAGPLSWPPGSQSGDLVDSNTGGTANLGAFVYGPLTTNPLLRIDSAAPLNGPPEPPIASSYAPYYVGFGTRVGAAFIDIFFMSLFQTGTVAGLIWKSTTLTSSDLATWIGESWVFLCLGLMLLFLYHVVQLSIWGQTIGKRLMSIKVVRADGGLPGLGQVVLRMLGYVFSVAVAGWGFVMVALDPRRQGLHDRIAETYVVPERSPTFVPAGLPGYGVAREQTPVPQGVTGLPAPAVGMAAVASPSPPLVSELAAIQVDTDGEVDTAGIDSEMPVGDPPQQGDKQLDDHNTRLLSQRELTADKTSTQHMMRGPVTDMNIESARYQPDLLSRSERARALFKQGITEMERGASRGSTNSPVEPGAARAAAYAFQEALLLVPSSVAYRYYYAVALRYSTNMEAALHEFQQVLELDPNHYEARQQIAYGQRWHDAFAYPAWVSPAPVEKGAPLPPALAALLPPGHQPVTRLVLLREGGNKMVALLCRTPAADWAAGAQEVPARLHLRLSRTPAGPIVAVYVVLQDRPHDPYVGETFLNPHDPDHPTVDACRLGQHMLEQLSRQDRTYLIFVDEENRLLMSRKLVFDAPGQVSITRLLYEAQTLPPQALDAEHFREAAEWHMQHFPLDEIKSAGS